jgi:hypothetical protein
MQTNRRYKERLRQSQLRSEEEQDRIIRIIKRNKEVPEIIREFGKSFMTANHMYICTYVHTIETRKDVASGEPRMPMHLQGRKAKG